MVRSNKIWFWLITTMVVLAFLYLVSNILLPFVVAIITAYFLDPAADKIESWGVSRILATIFITTVFFTVLILACLLLIPILYEQFSTLLQKIPLYIHHINDNIVPYFADLLNKIDPNTVDNMRDSINGFSGQALGFLGTLMKNVWSSGIALLNVLSLLFITPVVTFYVLKDWDRITAKVTSWLPPKHKPVIIEQCQLINRTLSGYIRGQTNVCILLGVFYGVGLTMAKLEFGLFIGLATGILCFIPYVGMMFGVAISLAIAFFQFGDLYHMAIILGIFIVGQVLEGSIVSPYLVGEKVGLHPVWIIFGLLSGGAIFGFVGILLSIPVTAVIGVLIRFFMDQYLHSALYRDQKLKQKRRTKTA